MFCGVSIALSTRGDLKMTCLANISLFFINIPGDFGVGQRMPDFCSSAWKSIRQGGFLLCHSTLTNENTRNWLEAVRAKSSQEVTGIPPDEYVELSLLEPHKHYQNSITLIQKRKTSETGTDYQEPLYSTFA